MTERRGDSAAGQQCQYHGANAGVLSVIQVIPASHVGLIGRCLSLMAMLSRQELEFVPRVHVTWNDGNAG